MSKIASILAIFLGLTLALVLAVHPVAAQTQRQIPMWEGMEKTALQKRVDQRFILDMNKGFDGDRDRASHYAVVRGWEQIEKGDFETAIKRFNQAWLLNPQRGDIYWGFAVAMAERGDDLEELERFFVKAERIIGPEAILHADWGIVLERRDRHNEAIEHFSRSIELDPKNIEAHAGMVRSSVAIGDRKTAEKHDEIYRSLIKK